MAKNPLENHRHMVNVFGMFGFFQRNRSRGKVPVMSMSCTLMDRIFWLFLRKSSSQHIVFKRAIPPERLPSSQLTEIYSFRPGNCASQKPFKINNGCTSIVEGFWPVSPVAHFPASRCHGSYRLPRRIGEILYAGHPERNRCDQHSHVSWGYRQGFESKTHGCVIQECCRTLPPLSGCSNDSCTIHTPHIPPTAWAQGCLLNPSRPPPCNPLQIQ